MQSFVNDTKLKSKKSKSIKEMLEKRLSKEDIIHKGCVVILLDTWTC